MTYLNLLIRKKIIVQNAADRQVIFIIPFIFPVPPPGNVLFHKRGDGNPGLIWQLFRNSVDGISGVDVSHFEDALNIHGVATPKLTKTLFLINPEEFIPINKDLASLVSFHFEGVKKKISLDEYKNVIGKVRDSFPGCKLFEINLFSYLRNRNKLPVHAHRCFQISTNVYNQEEDYWDVFDEGNFVFTGGKGEKNLFPINEPKSGDIILVRNGTQNGRGIGIVHQNEYTDGWTTDARLHVLWLNKRHAKLVRRTGARIGFSEAHGVKKIFRETAAYMPTFDLIESLSDSSGTRQTISPVGPSSKYPRNRILYGPPGTGKTWHTVNHALAIIDNEIVRSDDDKLYRGKFRRLRFNRKTREGQIEMVTFHQNFAYEDFIEGIRPKLDGPGVAYELQEGIFKRIANAARANADERFVLVIDEINRGNIAKIFGELITLIEDSRRLGQDDATEVTLPYSEDTFCVPDNLYIIGTMNTADRSIQLLDTALRRRFTFTEMMPEPHHPKIETDVDGVNCQDLLKAINKRIVALNDREHQIGHTYFFNVASMNELSHTFRHKIFPLLQEYFFDDWEKIRAVLGYNSFVRKIDPEKTLLNRNLIDDEKKIYERLADDNEGWLNPSEYKKIYEHTQTNGSNGAEPNP